MAKRSTDTKAAAIEKRQKLATARIAKREEALSEIPELDRVTSALRNLGESAQHPAMRREILALAGSYQRVVDLRQQEVDRLSGPGVSELLLPLGVANRLREAGFLSVQQVRHALSEGGSELRRVPAIGAGACDLIRAHLDALDADAPPPPKAEIRDKQIGLTKREKVLAEKMGLTAEQAGELLKAAGQALK